MENEETQVVNKPERETFEVITPIKGHKVLLKSYITGREKREIQNVFIEDAEVSSDDANNTGKSKMKMTAEKMNKLKDKTVEAIVISVDGVKENVVDTILDLVSKDYDFVMKEVDKISSADDDTGEVVKKS